MGPQVYNMSDEYKGGTSRLNCQILRTNYICRRSGSRNFQWGGGGGGLGPGVLHLKTLNCFSPSRGGGRADTPKSAGSSDKTV